MNHLALSKQFFEANLRVEKIIHLAGALSFDCHTSDAEDAFNEDPELVFEALGLPVPEDDGSDIDMDQICDLLLHEKKLGFLVWFCTPVPTRFHKEPEGMSYSWGYTQGTWIYAETIEDAFSAGFKWREKYIEDQRREYFEDHPQSE